MKGLQTAPTDLLPGQYQQCEVREPDIWKFTSQCPRIDTVEVKLGLQWHVICKEHLEELREWEPKSLEEVIRATTP